MDPTVVVDEKLSQKTKDITVIRLASEQGLSIWLTPLIVPALEHLLKDISTHVRASTTFLICL